MITLTTEQAQQIEEALSELMDLMDGVREGDYKPDSFTNQPAEEALATIRAARAQEQAEQEPAAKHWHDLYREKCQELHDERARLGAEIVALEQAEQEPVYAFRRKGQKSFCTCDKERYKELSDKSNLFEVTTFYAAPVRTKDLTDDVIMKINVDTASIVPTCDRQFHFARAVIAADREKNK